MSSDTSSVPLYLNPPHIDFIDPWDNYYQTNTVQSETDFHACHAVEPTEQVECVVSSSSDTFSNPHTIRDDQHSYSHTENANVDLQAPEITESHNNIPSSSDNDEFNSHFHQPCVEVTDTYDHSINTNSFLTANHDNSHNNTLCPTTGNETLNTGEQYSNGIECYDGPIEDVNDDETTTGASEEVGKL